MERKIEVDAAEVFPLEIFHHGEHGSVDLTLTYFIPALARVHLSESRNSFSSGKLTAESFQKQRKLTLSCMTFLPMPKSRRK